MLLWGERKRGEANMSVLSHLTQLSSRLVISDVEDIKIERSIETLSSRVSNYFGTEIRRHFIFGSYNRSTILPRVIDEESDIDYMVVFNNNQGFKPNTFLDKLRRFVSYKYSTSEIHRSYPTIVLELNHIKFELVPATLSIWNSLRIPAPSKHYEEWIDTDPNSFNAELTRKNQVSASQIKPLIRLMKYWNAKNGSHLYSYILEKHLVEQPYMFCYNLKDYVNSAIFNLPFNYENAQSYREKVERARRIMGNVISLENAGRTIDAETEIKKLFPSF